MPRFNIAEKMKNKLKKYTKQIKNTHNYLDADRESTKSKNNLKGKKNKGYKSAKHVTFSNIWKI